MHATPPPYPAATAVTRQHRPSAPPPPRRPAPRPRWPLSSIMHPMGALPTAASAARGHVRDALSQWHLGHFSDTAELIASELVTNVIRAATSDDGTPAYASGRLPLVQVAIFSDRTAVLIQVRDHIPGQPVPRQAGPHDETGRGLAIVAALADWGTLPSRTGKIIYARFPKDTPPAPQTPARPVHCPPSPAARAASPRTGPASETG